MLSRAIRVFPIATGQLWRCQSSQRFCSTMKTSFALTPDGAKIVYDETGTDNATSAIVCMPGALGHARSDFTPQLEQLSATHRVVAIDPRGYGRSRPPERVFGTDFYERDAEDAAAVIKSLEGVEKVSVLGWSDGAISAVLLGGRHPALVDRMVVWGGNAFYDSMDLEMFNKTRDVNNWSARMREPMERTYGGREAFQKLWSGWLDAVEEIVANGGDLCKKEAIELQCPVLVVHGQLDAMVRPSHATYLAENIPKARLYVMPKGKHNLHLRYADEFNSIVRWFLREPF